MFQRSPKSASVRRACVVESTLFQTDHVVHSERSSNAHVDAAHGSCSVKKKSGLEDSALTVSPSGGGGGSDSEEEILNEFVPSPHPSLLSTLQRAAGRESDDDHTPSHLTPDNISRGASRDPSDNGACCATAAHVGTFDSFTRLCQKTVADRRCGSGKGIICWALLVSNLHDCETSQL